MGEPAWHAKARALYAECGNYAEVGRRLGHTSSAVFKALNPDRTRAWSRRDNARPGRQAEKTSWHRENYRGTCRVCGAETCRRDISQCNDCWSTSEQSRVHARRMQLCEWWAEGLTIPEIAVRFGWSKAYVGVEMSRMRRDGYSLPYRYRLSAPTHLEQVAA